MRRALVFCLFLSGLAGLLDEVVWGRGVAVLLGATAPSHALTLAVFLGGLALGAALFGRRADSSELPLRLYAVLELGVALTTAATPAALRWATGVFIRLAAPLYPEHEHAVGALKLVFAVALLLPPTVLMGGTLPVVVRALARAGGDVGGRVSTLYAANSAGAVLGALLGGLWMVPAVGLDRCALFAATLNVVAAAVALWPGFSRAGAATASSPAALDVAPAAVVRATRVAMLVSGFSSLLYETLWIRVLSLVLGGTAHAFPLMLAAFIGGITVGAHATGRRQRDWREALALFAKVEIAVAVAVALAFGAYERLPYLDLVVAYGLASNGTGYLLHLVFSFTVSALVMALPAVAIGATLPLAATIGAGDPAHEGRALGNIYAWNTFGNVLGASVGGLVVLPWLGLQGAFVTGGVLNALAGLLPLAATRERKGLRGPAILAMAATALLVLTPFRPELLSRGTFRLRGTDPGSWTAFHDGFLSTSKLLFHEDGATATVEVHEYADDTPTDALPNRSLRINGKPDASTRGDMQTQLMLGHLPMLLHAAPKNVLVVGLGSGATTSAVLAYGPDVRVTVVEISPEVVRAAALFEEINHGALRDPRVTVRIDDARTFVRLTREQFDVVISEPSNPWMPGIAGLFTDAFFADVKRVLSPGGVFVQWSQFYETNDEIIRMVVRTFLSAFPEATAWGVSGADVLMVGGADVATIDWQRLGRTLAEPRVAASLAPAKISGVAGLAALDMYSNAGLRRYAGEGPLQTDAWPLLEYAGAYGLYAGDVAEKLVEGDERLHWPAPAGLAIASYARGKALDLADALSVARAMEEWVPLGARLPLSALRRAAELDPARTADATRLLQAKFPNARLALFDEVPQAATNADELEAFARELAAAQLAQSSAFRAPRLAGAEAAMQRALALGVADGPAARAVLAEWRALTAE